jgi:hypothetical protein
MVFLLKEAVSEAVRIQGVQVAGAEAPGLHQGSRKNNSGIRAPIHRFCPRRSSVKYVNVFALLAS